jgi:hypothetical protein
LFFPEAAAELDAGAMKEPAGLESSVGSAERLCQEVRDLVVKVRSTLDHVRDVSIPDSTSNTMAGILEALAVKMDGEDPLVDVVRRQVTIGSESVSSLWLAHSTSRIIISKNHFIILSSLLSFLQKSTWRENHHPRFSNYFIISQRISI